MRKIGNKRLEMTKKTKTIKKPAKKVAHKAAKKPLRKPIKKTAPKKQVVKARAKRAPAPAPAPAPALALSLAPSPFDPTILYEDKDLLVINKPAGLLVHDDGRQVAGAGIGIGTGVATSASAAASTPLLTDWIIKHYPKTAKVGEPLQSTPPIARPGIVHRLDKGTSGVMVIAKTAKAYAHLKEQFQNRTVTKQYFAFVYGKMEDVYGIINQPIGRSKKDFRKWAVEKGARGEVRPAETWYTTIAVRDGFSFVEAEPKTGRTHQIRVHFHSIFHPIVADALYAFEKLKGTISGYPATLGFTRPALHAHYIEFIGLNGKKIAVEAPLPLDFLSACKTLAIDPEEIAKKVAKIKGV